MFNDKDNLQAVLEDFALEMRIIFLDKKDVMVGISLYDMFCDNLWGARVTYTNFFHEVLIKYKYHTFSDKHVFYAAEFLTDDVLNNIVKSIKQERDE